MFLDDRTHHPIELTDLRAGYAAMAADHAREAEALEWADEMLMDAWNPAEDGE